MIQVIEDTLLPKPKRIAYKLKNHTFERISRMVNWLRVVRSVVLVMSVFGSFKVEASVDGGLPSGLRCPLGGNGDGWAEAIWGSQPSCSYREDVLVLHLVSPSLRILWTSYGPAKVSCDIGGISITRTGWPPLGFVFRDNGERLELNLSELRQVLKEAWDKPPGTQSTEIAQLKRAIMDMKGTFDSFGSVKSTWEALRDEVTDLSFRERIWGLEGLMNAGGEFSHTPRGELLRTKAQARVIERAPFVITKLQKIGEIPVSGDPQLDMYLLDSSVCVAQDRKRMSVRCFDPQKGSWGKKIRATPDANQGKHLIQGLSFKNQLVKLDFQEPIFGQLGGAESSLNVDGKKWSLDWINFSPQTFGVPSDLVFGANLKWGVAITPVYEMYEEPRNYTRSDVAYRVTHTELWLFSTVPQ